MKCAHIFADRLQLCVNPRSVCSCPPGGDRAEQTDWTHPVNCLLLDIIPHLFQCFQLAALRVCAPQVRIWKRLRCCMLVEAWRRVWPSEWISERDISSCCTCSVSLHPVWQAGRRLPRRRTRGPRCPRLLCPHPLFFPLFLSPPPSLWLIQTLHSSSPPPPLPLGLQSILISFPC